MITPSSFALPQETPKWRYVEKRIGAVLMNFGFNEAWPALLEEPPLDATPAGMGRTRADAVTALARLFLLSNEPAPARWSMAGEVVDPRPPATLRFSSYHAIAAVHIGCETPEADAELIGLASSLTAELPLNEPELRIGCTGDAEEQAAHRALVANVIKASPCCMTCMASDPLRVLSCDEEICRTLAQSLPPVRLLLGAKSREFHDRLLRALEQAGIHAVDDPFLFSPGASGTVFALSARSNYDGTRRTVLVGARRDRLIESLGGPATPLIGLAIGIERTTATLAGSSSGYAPVCEVFIACQGEEARRWALKTALAERARGFRVELELRDVGWNEQLERAKRLKARVVVLAGQPGHPADEITLRDAVRDEARALSAAQLGSELKRLLR